MGEVVIASRFRGPPDSGNGGYVSGTVSEPLGGPAQVTLLRPPPLDRALELRSSDGASVLLDGDEEVARAVAARPDAHAPPPVSLEDAAASSRGYPGFTYHPFATCFVCGPEREEGDGLRIFPGPVDGGPMVASPWVPDGSLASGGKVGRRFVWAALDCPGAFAAGFGREHMVLGRLTLEQVGPVRAGSPHVVVGWPEGGEGRKRFAGTAMFDGSGSLVALARATWITIEPPAVRS